MSWTFFVVWILLFVSAGILIRVLEWAVKSPRFAAYRIRTPTSYEIPPVQKAVSTTLNLAFTVGIYAAFAYFLGEATIRPERPSVTGFIGETLGSLLLYDFLYYFLHRTMHLPRLMPWVHKVHHMVRYPTAQESSYLHPAETLAGVSLMLFSVWLLGPVSAVSFLAIFFLFTWINIIVHGNLVLPHPAFRLTNFWAASHDVHHHKLAYNYSSIFPFWDQLFGTDR